MERFGVTTFDDDRSVAVVEWFRLPDGKAYIRFDDDTRVHCFVAEELAAKFEEAATAQEWKFALIGYDDFTQRRTYRVDYMPPRELNSIDPTTNSGVRALNKAMRRRPKRIKNAHLMPAIEKMMQLATDVTIGQMESDDDEKKGKGADRAVNIYRAANQGEAINQADEHFDEKNERLDAGLATENVGLHKTYQIDPETHDQV